MKKQCTWCLQPAATRTTNPTATTCRKEHTLSKHTFRHVPFGMKEPANRRPIPTLYSHCPAQSGVPGDYVNCWYWGRKANSSSKAAGREEMCVDSFADSATDTVFSRTETVPTVTFMSGPLCWVHYTSRTTVLRNRLTILWWVYTSQTTQLLLGQELHRQRWQHL